jgi:bifunctional oligoribonuclease and PAP phosphatase NrnA
MDIQTKEIKEILSIPKYIAIISHRNPDGDAIGSSLGLFHYLNQLGHTVRMILPSDYPLAFAWMPDVEDITIFDLSPERSKEILDSADVVFCLDFNALDRIDKLGEYLSTKRMTKVLIDHHLDPEYFTDYLISDTSASSTCELVYQFIEDLGDKKMIDDNVAASLYTGMMTDTGSFKYATNPRLFRICGELKARGLDDYTIQDNIFNSLTEKQLRLMGHALANRMEILPALKTGIIHLTKQDYVDFDIQRGDTEGIVNQMMMMRNVKVACFVTEQPTIVKLSMRSKGDISVQEICQKHFNGGGHKNASGGFMHNSLNVVLKKLKEVLPLYLEERVK